MAALAIGSGLLFPDTATASANTDSNQWRVEITPYFFAAGLDGTAGAKGVTTNVDMSFSDVWDHLDSAFMGLIEVGKNRWFFAFEGIYFKLDGEKSNSWTGPGGIGTVSADLKVTSTEIVYQASVGYRILDGATKLDVYGAARYTDLESELKLTATTPAILFPGGTRKVDGSESWIDPVIGVRILAPMSAHWDFLGLLDVGGFGASGDIDRSYQWITGATWSFATDFSMKVGYRYFYQNYQNNGTVWDMVAKGPYIGLGIEF